MEHSRYPLLDFCPDELDEGYQLVLNTKVGDLSFVSAGESRNATTLAGLQRALNMPYAILTCSDVGLRVLTGS